MIEIQKFIFNPFQENTYVLWDETKECIIIDPGCFQPYEKEELKGFIDDNKLNPKYLINTHCHIDHVLGNRFVKETWKVPLFIHKLEEKPLHNIPVYAQSYGFRNVESSTPDKFIDETDKIQFGNSELEVLFTPGHSPGHMVFYSSEQEFCINGDVLFYGSIGRTDLPGGHHPTLIKSIKEKMFKLPNDTVVYTGHGGETTIGFEKLHNPFLR